MTDKVRILQLLYGVLPIEFRGKLALMEDRDLHGYRVLLRGEVFLPVGYMEAADREAEAMVY